MRELDDFNRVNHATVSVTPVRLDTLHHQKLFHKLHELRYTLRAAIILTAEHKPIEHTGKVLNKRSSNYTYTTKIIMTYTYPHYISVYSNICMHKAFYCVIRISIIIIIITTHVSQPHQNKSTKWYIYHCL